MSNLDTAVFFPSATCNLNCKYCSIDKNQALIDIDKKLQDSFNSDYYIEQLNKFFPEEDSLLRIETWGGEPFLHMERMNKIFNYCLNKYNKLETIFSSTNFSFPQWVDNFINMLKCCDSTHKFQYQLQLSCDGPEYINDFNRGKDTTKKCLSNFNELLKRLQNYEIPKNIDLKISLKPTLNLINLNQLDSKQKIIEYYQFFEESFIYPVKKMNLSFVDIDTAIPNFAAPVPATKDDGIKFAIFCKNCKEIQEENKICKYFLYYDNITPFSSNEKMYLCPNYNSFSSGCGAGYTQIGFLPDNLYSTCYEGFAFLLEEYKNQASESKRKDQTVILLDKFIEKNKNHFCLSEDKYEEFHNQVLNYHSNLNDNSRLNGILNEILCLAIAGQIDSKYLDLEEATKAANFINERLCFCYKNNYFITGSITTIPVEEIRLFLNGALDYIIK